MLSKVSNSFKKCFLEKHFFIQTAFWNKHFALIKKTISALFFLNDVKCTVKKE
jgi:hypothetical protein